MKLLVVPGTEGFLTAIDTQISPGLVASRSPMVAFKLLKLQLVP
jgi:hypothetical protein